MRKVSKGEADTANVTPEDAYVGAKYFDLVPLLYEEHGQCESSFFLLIRIMCL